ncbi:unnamed protein product, partial [Laminaria digitata]
SNLLATAAAPRATAVTRGSDVGARGGGTPRRSSPGPVADSNHAGGGDAPRSPTICGAVPTNLLATTGALPGTPVARGSDNGARGDGTLGRSSPGSDADSNRVGKGGAPRSPMMCGAIPSTRLGTAAAAAAAPVTPPPAAAAAKSVAGGSVVGARGGGTPRRSSPGPVNSNRVSGGDAPKSPMLCGAVSPTHLGTAAAAVAGGSNVQARGVGVRRGPSSGPVAESNRVGGGNAPRSPMLCGAVSPNLLSTAAAAAAAVARGSNVGARGDGMLRRPSPGPVPVAESNRVLGGGDAPRSPMHCGAVSLTLLGTAPALPAPAPVTGSSDVEARRGGMRRSPLFSTGARSFVVRTTV